MTGTRDHAFWGAYAASRCKRSPNNSLNEGFTPKSRASIASFEAVGTAKPVSPKWGSWGRAVLGGGNSSGVADVDRGSWQADPPRVRGLIEPKYILIM